MMKKLLYFSAVVTLAALPFAAQAAQEMMNNQTGQLRPAGTVSANNARNLDDLQDKLAEKAKEQGATGFVINSAGGDNHMYGTATIYK
jgi:MqsR-controlled colanic acid and biofilm protein A